MQASLPSSSQANAVTGSAGGSSKYDLDWYQQEALETLERLKGRAGLFMEMGTGKTRTALAYIHRHLLKRIVIVCTLDGMGAWEREISKMGLNRMTPYNRQPDDFGYYVLALDDENSLKERANLLNLWHKDYQIVLVNHEVFWKEPLRSRLLKFAPDCVIIDEAHKINHRSSKQARFAHTLGDRTTIESRMALTGTPVTNGIENYFSLYRFIDPDLLGRRWADFEQQHIIYGGWENRQITGYRDEEGVLSRVANASYWIEKDKAITLPAKQDIIIEVELSPVAQTAYRAMKRNSLAQIAGIGADGRPLAGMALARIALTTILRCQQITSGFCETLNGQIDISDEKLVAMFAIVKKAVMNGEKAVVFCRFRRDVARVTEKLKGFRTGVLIGGMSRRKRESVIDGLHFDKLDIVVAQIDTASLSIDLTPASVAVFYSTGYAAAPFIQARDRLHRRGQKRRVLYFYLLAKRTVDEKIYAILQRKRTTGSITRLVVQSPSALAEVI